MYIHSKNFNTLYDLEKQNFKANSVMQLRKVLKYN